MRITLSILFFILILFTNTSCNTDSYNDKVVKLDSISNRLSENVAALYEIDTVKVSNHYEIIMNDLDQVTQLLGKRKVYNEEAIILSDYRALRKNFSKFKPFRNDVKIESDLTIVQLNNLSTDLKKGIIEKNKVEEYYQKEFVHAIELNERVEGILTGLDKAFEKFEVMKKDVEIIKQDLKSGS